MKLAREIVLAGTASSSLSRSDFLAILVVITAINGSSGLLGGGTSCSGAGGIGSAIVVVVGGGSGWVPIPIVSSCRG